MKKNILTFLLILSLTGCGAYNLRVQENNANLYIENQLFKRIKIDNSFTYMGASEETLPNGIQGKLYQFTKSDKERIFIFVCRTKIPFIKMNRTKNILETGTFESGGGSYQYNISRFKMMQYCFLQKNIAVPIKDDIKVMIQYSEDLDVSNIAYDKWSDPWNLSDEQKEYLSIFNTKSIKSIEILY